MTPVVVRVGTSIGKQCHYCERKGTTRDHIVPRSLLRPHLSPDNHGHVFLDGTEIWNIVPACQRCNNLKSDKRSDCQCMVCVLAWQTLAPEASVEVRNVIEMALLEDAS